MDKLSRKKKKYKTDLACCLAGLLWAVLGVAAGEVAGCEAGSLQVANELHGFFSCKLYKQ